LCATVYSDESESERERERIGCCDDEDALLECVLSQDTYPKHTRLLCYVCVCDLDASSARERERERERGRERERVVH
jgi:hypothetical protein